MAHCAHRQLRSLPENFLFLFHESILFFTFGVLVGKSLVFEAGRIYRRVRIGVHVYLLEFYLSIAIRLLFDF